MVLDVLEDDPEWYVWSEAALAREMARGIAWINGVIYAEVSAGFARIEELEAALDPSPLPDFFIGAHAAVEGLPLLTRDPARISACFRGVRIISPGRPSRLR